MKYNPAFKDTKELFEVLGVESSWANSEGLSSLEQTLIASTCWYLEQMFPEHTENILHMSGKELIEYMNPVAGSSLTATSTILEAFSVWFKLLRKMYHDNTPTSP